MQMQIERYLTLLESEPPKYRKLYRPAQRATRMYRDAKELEIMVGKRRNPRVGVGTNNTVSDNVLARWNG